LTKNPVWIRLKKKRAEATKTENKTTRKQNMNQTFLSIALGVSVTVAIAVCIVAIALLVANVQASFWLDNLCENELVEPADGGEFTILNSKSPFLSISEENWAKFDSKVTLFTLNSDGTISCDRGFIGRNKDNNFDILPDAPADVTKLEIRYSAGSNRGFMLMWCKTDGLVLWLQENLVWSLTAPVSRPFLFLTKLA